jgi:lipoprotein NlpI
LIAPLGVPLFYARRYDDSIEQFQEALEMDPDCGYIRFRLALAFAQSNV